MDFSYGVFVGGFWGVFSHSEASGSQSFLFSFAFRSADIIVIVPALGGAFCTQLPQLTLCTKGLRMLVKVASYTGSQHPWPRLCMKSLSCCSHTL